MNIYQKLLQIQSKINGLEKNGTSGSGNYGYKYVTGAKVLEFIRPQMNELGLILKQEILSIENQRQDYTTKNGSKSEILSKVMMKFTWIDVETGDKDENLFGANGQNDWEKGLGSALTYAERYFLLKYFHIPTDEDDIDNDLRKKTDPKADPTQPDAGAKKELPKVTDWLSEEKFKEALRDKEKALKALDFYDGKTIRNNKVYGMKKDYRIELEKHK
ncbi:MAG: ERF family protein [Flavobacteriaceae bacterium]|jgi:hypothetical protein|nr:ERF family protein [Flavobacteriaceae bacterium]